MWCLTFKSFGVWWLYVLSCGCKFKLTQDAGFPSLTKLGMYLLLNINFQTCLCPVIVFWVDPRCSFPSITKLETYSLPNIDFGRLVRVWRLCFEFTQNAVSPQLLYYECISWLILIFWDLLMLGDCFKFTQEAVSPQLLN